MQLPAARILKTFTLYELRLPFDRIFNEGTRSRMFRVIYLYRITGVCNDS